MQVINGLETDMHALNISAPHVVIASPKGEAISFLMGLLRRPAKRGTSRMTNCLVHQQEEYR